jgi:predicted transposase YbfD/YdcC
MAHMVSAFVEANRMVFAQVKTDGKGHELSGIEKLLEMLDLNGAVVTIDAIACNKTIASLNKRTKAKRMFGYVRGHWSVENNLHWQLDVSFREEERRIRTGHGAENFSRLCRMSLNLLKQEKTQTTGIAIKRLACGWSNDYLLKVALGYGCR